MLAISWMAELVLASKEEFTFMELVDIGSHVVHYKPLEYLDHGFKPYS
jgi:hypothetical protein